MSAKILAEEQTNMYNEINAKFVGRIDMNICKNCATIVPDGAKFCPECGTVVTADTPVQPPVTENVQNTAYNAGTGSYGETVNLGGSELSGTYYFGGSNASSGTESSVNYSGGAVPPTNGPVAKKKGINPAVFVFGFLGVLLVILLVLLIAGPKDKDDPNLGVYECVSRDAFGYVDDGEGDWLELKERGKVTICMDNEEYNGKWELEGTELEISQSGDDFDGTLINGVIVLEFGDLICTYAKDGAVLPSNNNEADLPQPEQIVPEETIIPETVPEVIPEVVPEESALNIDWWQGDWYGWWIMNNNTGEYSDLEDSCWDTCAVINLDNNGEGTIELWDTDSEPGSYFAIVDVKLTESSSDIGCLLSTEGQMYSERIRRGEWIIDPAESYVSVYGNMIAIEGFYCDSDNAANSFEYMIFLRPWGTDWEDVRNDTDNTDMPYTDMMPVYYDDWYLLYKDGKMPDSFN